VFLDAYPNKINASIYALCKTCMGHLSIMKLCIHYQITALHELHKHLHVPVNARRVYTTKIHCQ